MTKPTDWKEVCRWAEVQVQIKTACHRWMFDAIEPPAMLTIDHEIDIDPGIRDPAGNSCSYRVPARFTHHHVGKQTGFLIVCEYCCSLETPLIVFREQTASFMTRPVDAAPNYALASQISGFEMRGAAAAFLLNPTHDIGWDIFDGDVSGSRST